MTWDPFRVFLDENYRLDASLESKLASYDYAYTVYNDTLQVKLHTAVPKK